MFKILKKSADGAAPETAQAAVRERPGRRVGTFTLGITLVAGGAAMLASLFWPELPMGWVLRLTPVILVVLGVEVLLAAGGGGKVRYDWMGMFLCFILTIFAMGLYSAAWWMSEGPGFPIFEGSWVGSQEGLAVRYDYFNDLRAHQMDLAAGDKLNVSCANRQGWLSVQIYAESGWDLVYEGDFEDQESLQVEIPSTDQYYIELYGHKAVGRASFTRIPGPNAGELDLPEDGGIPEEGEYSEETGCSEETEQYALPAEELPLTEAPDGDPQPLEPD